MRLAWAGLVTPAFQAVRQTPAEEADEMGRFDPVP